MRNLKKVLTLVLTLAMMLSVMVVGTGAAFTDQDAIVNKEAVDICSALNIIGGYEDGSFQPNGNITRAEMCKMISVALNGGREPNMGSNLANTFNDVDANNWAAPYIEYCVSQGIVSGVGGGNFAPNGNITGSQAAKMLLCILGYDAKIQGYVDNAYWETKINVDAAQKGLYDELGNIDASAPLTRDQAAQMIWNALGAYEVEYQTILTTENGVLVSKVVPKDKMSDDINQKKLTLLADKYEANIKYGYMTKVEYESIKGEYTYTFNETAFGGAKITDDAFTNGGTLKTTQDFSDLFGQKVAVVYKEKNNDKTVYGMYAESAVLASDIVGNITDGDGNDLSGANTQIKIGDVKYKMDGDTVSATGVYTYNVNTTTSALTDYTTNGYYSVDAIDHDGDGKIDCFVIYPVDVEKVTYVGANSITAGGSYTYDKDSKLYSNNGVDYDFPTVSKDEWVAIDKYGVDDMTRKVAAVSAVQGEITAKRDTNVQIDGTWYEKVKNPGDATYNVGDTVALTVVGGYYFNVEVIDGKSLDNVLMVLDAGKNSTGLSKGVEAKVMYAKDGSVSTISNVSKVNDNNADETGGKNAVDNYDNTDANKAEVIVGALYTYEQKDGAVELTRLGDNVIGDSKFGKSKTCFDADDVRPTVDGKYIADNAVVMVYDSYNDKYSFTTGAALKSWNSNYGATVQYLYDTINGVDTVIAVALYNTAATSIPGTSGSTSYGYVTANAIHTKEGDDHYAVLSVWTADGALPDVKAEHISNNTNNGWEVPSDANVKNLDAAQKGAFVTFEKLSNGNIDNLRVVGTAYAMAGTSVNRDGDVDLTLKNNSGAAGPAMTVNKDTQIIFVNTKEKTGEENSISTLADLSEWRAEETAVAGTYIMNVMIEDKATADGKADALFIDINKRLENVSNTVSVDVGMAGAKDSSQNLQLVFTVDNGATWFSADQISKLGITDDMITVTVNGTEKKIVPTATDTVKDYPWEGRATCILPAGRWNGFGTIYGATAGFMKVHVYDNTGSFSTNDVVNVSIRSTDDITFNYRDTGYKVS